MRATITLINALRKAADRIATKPFDYMWSLPEFCNCGTLAQELIGSLGEYTLCGMWSEMAAHAKTCQATGRPMPEVFLKLIGAGLEMEELQYIEHLDSPEVLVRLDWAAEERFDGWGDRWKQLRCSNPASVIAYFRAQADILEEALGNDFETRPLTLTPAKEPVGA